MADRAGVTFRSESDGGQRDASQETEPELKRDLTRTRPLRRPHLNPREKAATRSQPSLVSAASVRGN